MDLSKAIRVVRDRQFEIKNTSLAPDISLEEYEKMRELTLAIEIVLGQLEFLMEYEIESRLENEWF